MGSKGTFLMLSDQGAIASCPSLEMAFSQFSPITDSLLGTSVGDALSAAMTLSVLNPMVIACDKPANALRQYVKSEKTQKLPIHGPNGDLVCVEVKDTITELGECHELIDYCEKLADEKAKATLN